mmetsp:Transcript_17056/g.37564  ORF Transcript_17056/g.37564 Transcript_17056/m.37564 type:complete len:232 (+) Transcript_17056:453-1148(+)
MPVVLRLLGHLFALEVGVGLLLAQPAALEETTWALTGEFRHLSRWKIDFHNKIAPRTLLHLLHGRQGSLRSLHRQAPMVSLVRRLRKGQLEHAVAETAEAPRRVEARHAVEASPLPHQGLHGLLHTPATSIVPGGAVRSLLHQHLVVTATHTGDQGSAFTASFHVGLSCLLLSHNCLLPPLPSAKYSPLLLDPLQEGGQGRVLGSDQLHLLVLVPLHGSSDLLGRPQKAAI